MTDVANMVFFMSDNHTRNVVGACEHPFVQTPALDRIAVSGTFNYSPVPGDGAATETVS